MAYPSTLTTFTDPTPSDKLSTTPHSSIESDQNTALEEIQAFIGTESSTVGTLFYDVRGADSDGGGHVQTANKGGTGQTSYTKGDLLVATSSSVVAKLAVGNDQEYLTADSSTQSGVKWTAALTTFYGGGEDGALTTSVAAQNIDCGGSVLVEKNYSTIDVVTNPLTFSNPNDNGTVIILRSKGNVNISSSIVASAMGASGGASVAAETDGNAGTGAWGQYGAVDGTVGMAGGGGNAGQGNVSGGAGGGGASATGAFINFVPRLFSAPGAGGGSGGGASVSGAKSGDGGRGGGGLVLTCGGTYTFTGSMDTSGVDGTVGSIVAGVIGGSGGGGAGGMINVFYSVLGTHTGGYHVSGGVGPDNSGGASGEGGSGGGGASPVNPGTTGDDNTTGTDAGDGGAGDVLVIATGEFS